MAIMPQTIEKLARIGVNLEISAECKLMPATVEKIVRIVVDNGAQITVDSSNNMPQTLEKLARSGGKNLTIRA